MPDVSDTTAARPAGFRYGAVLLCTLVVVVFAILAPVANWSRAVVFALESAALLVVIATSRTRPDLRRTRVASGTVTAAAWGLAMAAGVLPAWLVSASVGLVSIAIPLALIGGLLRLVRRDGATLQAVAGSLAIYLLIGLAFAWTIGIVEHLDAAPYFANGTDGTESARVYFSFTTLTTTGFGDLAAGTSVGRALAVLEMLVGQLYLVTVIGVLVGSFARR
jgi:ion channel